MEKIIASRAVETERMNAERQSMQRAEQRFKAAELQATTHEKASQQLREKLEDTQQRLRAAERSLQDKERDVLTAKASAAEAKKNNGLLESSLGQMRTKLEGQNAADLELRETKTRVTRLTSEVSTLREQNGWLNKELRGPRLATAHR
eukprot:TRINITY_DN59799_c0_g1_i1.p1 TRINITY_DN59799_c0_g1~~TRINITY_DN59799_c0_g1_i1.p1  ORF type:complete len:163 (+),score=76.17 TRINITY_DN59799_c0_g1_i1:47-490(+)